MHRVMTRSKWIDKTKTKLWTTSFTQDINSKLKGRGMKDLKNRIPKQGVPPSTIIRRSGEQSCDRKERPVLLCGCETRKMNKGDIKTVEGKNM